MSINKNMFIFSGLLALILFSDKSFSGAQERPIIQVLPKVEVSAKVLKLGDLIRSSGLDANTVSELNGLSLGDAPRFGETRKFSDRGLSALLRYHLGLKEKELGNDLLDQVQLKIPHEVIVEGAGLVVSEAEIKTEVLSKISDACGSCQVEISQMKIGVLRKYPLEASWSIRLDNSNIRGPFSAKIEIVYQLKILDRVPITGTVHLYRDVPVAQSQLNIGDRVQESDVKFVRREVTTAQDMTPSMAELQNAKLRRGVRANQIVWRGDLERERLIHRGDQVEVFVSQESWKISLKAIAQDSGMIGDRIRVTSLTDHKKTLNGVVIGKGQVELQ